MKKILFSVGTLGVLFASSCKKSDNGGSSTPANYWTLGGTTYTPAVVTSTSTSNTIDAVDVKLNSCSFYFAVGGAPAAGTYKVVNNLPNAGEVLVVASTPASVDYESTGNDHVTATVSVSGSKISISLPNTVVKNDSNPNDSLVLSAKLTQTN